MRKAAPLKAAFFLSNIDSPSGEVLPSVMESKQMLNKLVLKAQLS